jgi:hypothetical protein
VGRRPMMSVVLVALPSALPESMKVTHAAIGTRSYEHTSVQTSDVNPSGPASVVSMIVAPEPTHLYNCRYSNA